MANDILPHSDSDSQDSNAAIVAMLDELLAQDNLFVKPFKDGWGVFEFEDPHQTTGWLTVDEYDTRVAAYRAALDVEIELCINAWCGGEEE